MSTLAALIAAGALAPGKGVLRVNFNVRASVFRYCGRLLRFELVAGMYVCMYVCVCARARVCVCVCVCVLVIYHTWVQRQWSREG